MSWTRSTCASDGVNGGNNSGVDDPRWAKGSRNINLALDGSLHRDDPTTWTAIAVICAALLLTVSPLGPLAKGISRHLANLSTTSSTPASAAVTHHRAPLTQIPEGLQQAIHRTIGPGPIGLGTAPLVSGIQAAKGGWTVKAPAGHVSATVTRPDPFVPQRPVPTRTPPSPHGPSPSEETSPRSPFRPAPFQTTISSSTWVRSQPPTK
jgi:hypothetical protein